MSNSNTSLANGPLPFHEKFGWAIGDLGQNLIIQTVSTYLLFFYTNVYGLPAADAATMFLVVRMIDAINDPIVGTFVDKHNTKWGKYRGYLLITSIPLAIMATLCFYVPNFGSVGKLVYAYVTYVGMSLIYTTVNIPYGSLNASMTRNNQELISMNSLRMFLAQIGGILVTFGIPIFVKLYSGGYYSGVHAEKGWFLTMMSYGVLAAVILLFTFSQSIEHIHMDTTDEANIKVSDLFRQLKINHPLQILATFFIITFGLMSVTGAVGAYYMTYNANNPDLMKWYNLIGLLPIFIVLPIQPKISKKFGTQALMQTSLIISILGSLMMFCTPATNLFMTFAGHALQNCGILFAETYEWALVPQTITYGEWKTGKRENGIVNAIVGFFFKFGMALGGIIPGYVLAAFGFVANQTQTAHSLFGIKLLTTIIPVILTVLAMVVFHFYRLTNEKVEKLNQEIIQRKATK
ncbi:glycoside-pentoside-hexuronide (GPH):cation symporter [Limosilactobacillus sp.]|uniref:glycoside-pentoside-hexuronide (GPH):cation symporter n=1 Tax=Limosilactobacillus sp. TaxID=2773925 RepID=UPI003F060703